MIGKTNSKSQVEGTRNRKAMGATAILLASGLLLAACDGAHEQAGEKADAAAGVGGDPIQSGPSESIGEAQDEIERNQKRAVDARADATEAKADEVREMADQKADALEKQADQIRDAAKQKGEALDKQAEQLHQGQ